MYLICYYVEDIDFISPEGRTGTHGRSEGKEIELIREHLFRDRKPPKRNKWLKRKEKELRFVLSRGRGWRMGGES